VPNELVENNRTAPPQNSQNFGSSQIGRMAFMLASEFVVKENHMVGLVFNLIKKLIAMGFILAAMGELPPVVRYFALPSHIV